MVSSRLHALMWMSWTSGLLLACGGASEPSGPPLGITVAPLSLPGVTDVTYRLSVSNLTGDAVWTRTITSTQFGDGAGGVSYVGTCDASEGESPNTVALEILEIRTGATALVDGRDFYNPAPSGSPLTLPVPCVENRDNLAAFDITVMRAANQGFFDFAVTFEDIFCSAKLDCGPLGDDMELLHNPHTDSRDTTVVLGFSCTAGAGTPTYLHMDDVVVTCGDQVFKVDVADGPGNLNPYFPGPPNTTELFFQTAIYRANEELTDGQGTSLNKAYWNVALGLNRAALPNLGACVLTAKASASERPFEQGHLPPNSFYPYVVWNVPLTNTGGARVCTSHALDAGGGVTTAYTRPSDGLSFDATYSQATSEVVAHPELVARRTSIGNTAFGLPLALGDFNGDTFEDLAVATLGAVDGPVSVYRGSKLGPTGEGETIEPQLLELEGSTRLGAGLAAGDLTGDGFDDLLIAAPDDEDGAL